MKKFYSPSEEWKPAQSLILAIIPELVALQLRPLDIVPKELFFLIWPGEKKYVEVKLTVAVVIIIPRYENKVLETLLIRERNAYKAHVVITKFPSGSMDREDKDILAAVTRESRTETGYEARDIQFCFAAEYSSTIAGERHVKAFFIAKSHEKVGEPTEKDVLEVTWMPFLEVAKINGFPKNQRVVIPEIHTKIMGINTEMALALLNNKTGPSPMEGIVE